MRILITAILAMLGMSIVYWLIQKGAEWIDDRRIAKMKPEEFSGIGTREDGTGVFDARGHVQK